MDIIVNDEVKANVGDIIEFSHSGSSGEGSFYLICYCVYDGYFILNTSGSKSRLKFYKDLNSLMKYHRNSIVKVYSKNEWGLALTRK